MCQNQAKNLKKVELEKKAYINVFSNFTDQWPLFQDFDKCIHSFNYFFRSATVYIIILHPLYVNVFIGCKLILNH